MRRLSLLVAGCLAFWAVVVFPIRLVDETAFVFSGVACLLCLLPTVVTFIWCHKSLQGTSEQRLLAVLGGSGVRMLFVIGAGMALFHLLPAFHYQRFWLWIIVFYLFTLTLEMVLLLTGQAAAGRSHTN
jgi:hypothetical protein